MKGEMLSMVCRILLAMNLVLLSELVEWRVIGIILLVIEILMVHL